MARLAQIIVAFSPQSPKSVTFFAQSPRIFVGLRSGHLPPKRVNVYKRMQIWWVV